MKWINRWMEANDLNVEYREWMKCRQMDKGMKEWLNCGMDCWMKESWSYGLTTVYEWMNGTVSDNAVNVVSIKEINRLKHWINYE